jgi:hypothetical protein
MTESELPASLAAFGYPTQRAAAVIGEQSPGQRFTRALGGLFIPVAHFVLVPTFLTVGVIVAVKRAREDRRLLLVRGPCPRCGVEQAFKPGGRFVSGRSLGCPRCHGNLTLVADPATNSQ